MADVGKAVFSNTTRRDVLIDIEKKYQKVWKEEKAFEVNAPTEDAGLNGDELRENHPKFFGSMAYPYMNGVLHAGHSFTLSKVEFAAGFARMQGKRALFPLGFHCTGMPIKACADKLVREIEMFGENFDQNLPSAETQEAEAAAGEAAKASKEAAAKTDPTKFKAKKSKAVAKAGTAKFQHEIMMQLGIPREEVRNFAEADYWLKYFPPLCQEDCDNFGARIDWRRSFVTTETNPYYDAFVRWQVRKLKDLGKIKFGERYTIYSAKDGQPCMDHDRSSGEGVNPQEYTGIKIRVLEFPQAALETLQQVGFDASAPTFLVAATLRPETMYGQTCCFVSPKIRYGIFDAGNGEFFITTERAFKNMSFQKLTPKRGEYAPVCEIDGSDLIGARIHAPLAVHPELRVLPMETIIATKGTGVVTCVPSDSPDDYITYQDLRNKPEYYGIQKEWTDAEPVGIIATPNYGNLTAEKLVQDLKIRSPKDKDLLAKAKEIAYKEGFYQGVMCIGKYSGDKVEDAKPKTKADMVAAGEAFTYNEPEGPVSSRSGDECIVSLEDQWYMDYGEEQWRERALECLEQMNVYSDETRNQFKGALGWLKNWALSRTYGLGTKIPWDDKYLVESLSDSTVYMAYYTIAHFLHSDIEGQKQGLLGVSPEDMTDDVFDYIFLRSETKPESMDVAKLDAMRREFDYFYPVDIRVSGKDLIPNHLTFFIYCHTALFPKRVWPKGIRANGHLLLNHEKMSKSTGNFMTLKQITEKFGADASRIALADAGDSFEDANFDEENANAAILRLYTLKEWCEEMVKDESLRTDGNTFLDKVFDNEMNVLISEAAAHYAECNYKYALKSGLFDFMSARDYYRDSTSACGGMRKDLVLRFIECQALMLAPVAPHFAEYIYRDVLGKSGSVQSTLFPAPSREIDLGESAALQYVRDLCRAVRETEGALLKKKTKKGPSFDAKKPARLSVYVASSFPEWQSAYIDLLQDALKNLTIDGPSFKQDVAKLGDVKRGMQYVQYIKSRLNGGESADVVFNRKLVFDEVETLKQLQELVQRSAQMTNIEQLQLIAIQDGGSEGVDIVSGEKVEVPNVKATQDAVPGSPGLIIANIE